MHQSGCYTENLLLQVWASLYRNRKNNKNYGNWIIQDHQVARYARWDAPLRRSSAPLMPTLCLSEMLSKKKSRPIVVEDTRFRWAISPDSGYVVFVAEREDIKGRKIEVYIDTDINNFWVEFPNIDKLNLKVIKPKDAANIISQAIHLGWKPNEKGAPLVFDYPESGELLLKKT